MRVPISQLSSYLAPFLRYGDLLAESGVFFIHTPLLFLAPAPYLPVGISGCSWASGN